MLSTYAQPYTYQQPYVYPEPMMNLGPYLSYHRGSYYCTLCDRYFSSEVALLSHCRNTTQHEWCERCGRVFCDMYALDAHLEASSAHHICHACGDDGPDFNTGHELDAHIQVYHAPRYRYPQFKPTALPPQHHVPLPPRPVEPVLNPSNLNIVRAHMSSYNKTDHLTQDL
jgi:hypothetical protein